MPARTKPLPGPPLLGKEGKVMNIRYQVVNDTLST